VDNAATDLNRLNDWQRLAGRCVADRQSWKIP
jgi:hypothetical protein